MIHKQVIYKEKVVVDYVILVVSVTQAIAIERIQQVYKEQIDWILIKLNKV